MAEGSKALLRFEVQGDTSDRHRVRSFFGVVMEANNTGRGATCYGT
jgi:hypothetical protein